MRSAWGPPLALLAALALWMAIGVAPAHAQQQRCAGADAAPESIPTQRAERAVECLVNRIRANRGLRALRPNRSLRRAARSHTRVMVNQRCFTHECAGEPDLRGRMFRANYFRACPCRRIGGGETIAWRNAQRGSPRGVVSLWMGSPQHRGILLNPRRRHIGVGTAWSRPFFGSADVPAGVYTADVGFFVRR